MTPQEIDRIESAIRHIQTAVDVDPWAVEIAVEAMKTQLSAEGTTSDLISRQAAIEVLEKIPVREFKKTDGLLDALVSIGQVYMALNQLPSAQPERTEYIPDTKAVRSKRDCVDLAERVDATFYDQEHEEWTQKTVTIADVLDSVCDEYTILTSAQPEPHYCRECKWSRCHINVDKYGNTETYWHCRNWDGGTDEEGYCYEWERKDEGSD